MACKIIPFIPHVQEQPPERMYSETQVKELMYCICRDVGCKWCKSKLEQFIESAFSND